MIRGLDPNFRMVEPPSRMPSHYSVDLLQRVRQMEEDGVVVLNPFDLSIKNVLHEDKNFRNDLNLHKMWIRYHYDQLRPAPASPKNPKKSGDSKIDN